jgi:hypothetical protein
VRRLIRGKYEFAVVEAKKAGEGEARGKKYLLGVWSLEFVIGVLRRWEGKVFGCILFGNEGYMT